MARTRSLADMRTDIRRLADLENATARFPDAEVSEYANKALAHVYAEMLTAQDRPYFSSTQILQITVPPAPGQVGSYPLSPDFLSFLSVAHASSQNGPWTPLEPYEEADRALLQNTGFYGGMSPLRYGLAGGPGVFTQGTIPVTYSIELLPQPQMGSFIQVRYVPTCPRLVNDTDTFDGLLGFEDAACTWAAILMRRKDDLETADLERDMARHVDRIRVIAKRRDRSRPPKISIVRGRPGMRALGGRGWGTW